MAERLRTDGLKVWFDEWQIKPGDNIPKKIEDGLEDSRLLVLCMSAHAFGSEWAKLEANTFDLLCHLAFDALVLTRCQRADRVNRQETTFNKFFAKETGEIMNNLQEKHTSNGELQLTLP